MRKALLIFAMIIALTFAGMGMGAAQAQNSTTEWTVVHFCIHDSQNESLMENDSLSTYVMAIVHKKEPGDYGSITIGDTDQKFTVPFLESDGQGYVFYLKEQLSGGNGAFSFKAVDQDGAECTVQVQMQSTRSNYVLYLSVKYGNKILYWIATYIKEEQKIIT